MYTDYKWIKIIDISGKSWEYENVKVKFGFTAISILLPSLETNEVKVIFYNKNVISVRSVRTTGGDK